MSNASETTVSPHIRSFLRALASDGRQKVLLIFADGKEHTVGEVAIAAGIGQSTASEQLATLREAGLMQARRDGKTVYYRPDGASIMAAVRDLTELLRACCPPSQ